MSRVELKKKSPRIWAIGLAAGLLCGAAAGCHSAPGKLKGQNPSGRLVSVLAVQAGDTPRQVMLRGIMVEKCPVAGCWFKLRDQTGIIKVDTKSSGFVVQDVPLLKEITVAGKLAYEGDKPVLEATGLRY